MSERFSDMELVKLRKDFLEHAEREEDLLARMEKHVLRFDDLLPRLEELATRWQQAKGIFWFVVIVSAGVTSLTSAFDWFMTHFRIK